MKKINITLLVLCLLIHNNITAQDTTGKVQKSYIEFTNAQSLWFNSNNCAGIRITPLNNYNIVALGFKNQNGNYKMSQNGKNINNIGLNTEGAIKLGKSYLWGSFVYNNETSNKSSFITNLYDPFRDMPYYVADSVVSKWKKQQYTMNVKAAFPELWHFLGTGCEIEYDTRTGAKQNDPRGLSYYLTLNVKPSLTFKINNTNIIGLNVNYGYLYERTTFSLSDNQSYQKVYIMTGLGNYSIASVGGIGGINTFYYKGHKLGGSLQYNFNGNGKFSSLVEGTYHFKVEDAMQTPSKPQNMGTTKQNLWEASVQTKIESDSYMNKLTAKFTSKKTEGIEYIQELHKAYEVQKWVTLAKYIRICYKLNSLSFNYDFFTKKDSGYNWNAGLAANYSDKYEEYYIPNTKLKAKNILFNVYAKKHFNLCPKSSLLTGFNFGYNNNIKGEYKYGGIRGNSPVVTDMFANDILYLSQNYYVASLDFNFSTMVSSKTSFFAEAKCQYYKPTGSYYKNRIYSNLSIGIVF